MQSNRPQDTASRLHRLARTPAVLAALAAALASWAAPLHAAELGRLDLAAPGAMISSCSGMNMSGSDYFTGDKGVWLPGQVNCNAQLTASPSATVAQSSAYQVPSLVDAASHGYARMGQAGLYATFFADNSHGFAQAEATGGWADRMTLVPVDPNAIGSTATLVFGVHVEGLLTGLPMGNSGVGISVRPYLDGASLLVQPEFKVGGQGQFNFPYDQLVDAMALFSAEVTLGEEFELGVFVRAVAGIAGAGGVPGTIFSGATADFANTMSWGGISSVTVGGVAVPYQLNSASGIDWTQAFGAPLGTPLPEPGTLGLLMAAAAGLAIARRCAGPARCR